MFVPSSPPLDVTTVKLDKDVYSWTDKVFITVTAPDHNLNATIIDEIGNNPDNPIKVATRSHQIDQYKLVETGPNTGVFTGHVILTGFGYASNSFNFNNDPKYYDTNSRTGDTNGQNGIGLGPTNGFIETKNNQGITVSFKSSNGQTIIDSSPIQWNVGKLQWLETSYSSAGPAVLQVIDTDMNLNPESIDNFQVEVWSTTGFDSIDLTVTETGPATGIFEGTVFFNQSLYDSSDMRLNVSSSDRLIGEYRDYTLPPSDNPDYRGSIELEHETLIDPTVLPLERQVVNPSNVNDPVPNRSSMIDGSDEIPTVNPVSNSNLVALPNSAFDLRLLDAFRNPVSDLRVGQQVQIVRDISNDEYVDQGFVYYTWIKDSNDDTPLDMTWVANSDSDSAPYRSLWISGIVPSGNLFAPGISWTPQSAGTYEIHTFVWRSLSDRVDIVPPAKITVTALSSESLTVNQPNTDPVPNLPPFTEGNGLEIPVTRPTSALSTLTSSPPPSSPSNSAPSSNSAPPTSPSDLRILDASRNPVSNALVEQRISITRSVTNNDNDNVDQQFVYVARVRDGNGETVNLQWITNTLQPRESSDFDIFWTPESPGTYDVSTFVWDSLGNRIDISPPARLAVTVLSLGSLTINQLYSNPVPSPSSSSITDGNMIEIPVTRPTTSTNIVTPPPTSTPPPPTTTLLPPLPPSVSSDLRIVDAFGKTVNDVRANQIVGVSRNIENTQNTVQNFVYAIQVKSGNTESPDMKWVTGALQPGQSFASTISWIPKLAGTYEISSFVWDSLGNRVDILPPAKITVTVSSLGRSTVNQPDTTPVPNSPSNSNPDVRLVAISGKTVNEVHVGQPVAIIKDVTSDEHVDQPFVYYVWIKDSNDDRPLDMTWVGTGEPAPIHSQWITGTLTQGLSSIHGVGWTPQSAGTYDIDTFVWRSLIDRVDVLPPAKITVTVLPSESSTVNQPDTNPVSNSNSELRLVDDYSNTVNDVRANQIVGVSRNIGNDQNIAQNFVFFIDVKNSNDESVDTQWISGTLEPGQSFLSRISWIPKLAGTYEISSFVWDSLGNRVDILPSANLTVTVN